MSVNLILAEAEDAISSLFYSRQRNMSQFYRGVGEILLYSLSEQFDSEGVRYYGKRWEPLAKSTKEDRIAKGFSASAILNRRGGYAGLAGSFTSKIFSDGVSIGTNYEYAAIHHFGGVISHPGGTPFKFAKNGIIVFVKKSTKNPAGFTRPHKIRIPARPIFPKTLPQDDIDDIIALYSQIMMIS